MKRSKMILIIRTNISEWLGVGCDVDEADYILTKIEEAGMLPPTSIVPDQRGHDFSVTMNSWEPEDDS